MGAQVPQCAPHKGDRAFLLCRWVAAREGCGLRVHWALSFPEGRTPTRELSHGPDSQALQPKFNFQLLLTLEKEAS